MFDFWKSLSGNTRFSVIAFVISAALGLISMGALGTVLYYPVLFLLKRFPAFCRLAWRLGVACRHYGWCALVTRISFRRPLMALYISIHIF